MKMKKLSIQLYTIILFVAIFLCFSLCVNAETVLKRGDSVIFGSYEASPLSWRVFKVEDGKVVLVSDKAFKNIEYHTSSSLWETSSVRQWLNSTGGFLSAENFTPTEVDMLCNYTVDSVVNSNITGITYEGNNEHIYNSSVKNALQNYEEAYRVKTQDKVFIPGVCEVVSINEDPYSFGVDYYMTQHVGSDKAFSDYWLRDSMYGQNTGVVRCVTSDGKISYEKVTADSPAVRPMCALSEEKVGISSGNGSVETPYVIADDDYLVISADKDAVWQGGSIGIKIYGKGTENSNVALFRNGKNISQHTSTNLQIDADSGVNVFSAYVYDESGKPVMISKPVSVWGQNYEVVSQKCFYDFEENNPLGSQNIIWSEEYGKDGKGLCITSVPNTQAATNSISLDKSKTAVLIDVDIKFDTFNVLQNDPLRIKVMPSGEFIMPVRVNAGGYVSLNGTDALMGSFVKLTEGKWYNFKLVINDKNKTVSFAVDDVVYAKDVPLDAEFDYSNYMIISASWNNTSESNKICIDNLKVTNVIPMEQNFDMFHILHPDKVSLTAIGVNNSAFETPAVIIASQFGSSGINKTVYKDDYISENGYSVGEFDFENVPQTNGYYKIFMFEDIGSLKPMIPSVIVTP